MALSRPIVATNTKALCLFYFQVQAPAQLDDSELDRSLTRARERDDCGNHLRALLRPSESNISRAQSHKNESSLLLLLLRPLRPPDS